MLIPLSNIDDQIRVGKVLGRAFNVSLGVVLDLEAYVGCGLRKMGLFAPLPLGVPGGLPPHALGGVVVYQLTL